MSLASTDGKAEARIKMARQHRKLALSLTRVKGYLFRGDWELVSRTLRLASSQTNLSISVVGEP